MSESTQVVVPAAAGSTPDKTATRRHRVIVGDSVWAIPDGDPAIITSQIKTAMEQGSAAEVELLDSVGDTVTVYINGRAAPWVVVDLNGDPRPSQMSD